MKYTFPGIICILLSLPFWGQSQAADTAQFNQIISPKLSDKYVHAISSRSADIQEKMEKGTEKYLDKLKKQEEQLQKQLTKIDASAADRIFKESGQTYDKLQNDVRNNSENLLKSYGKYVPGMDSAITSLKFLQQNEIISGKLGNNISQVKDAMSKVKELEAQFKKTDNIEEFIKERKEYLRQQLSAYNLPGLQQYNQQAAYYAQQMNEYKQAWEDPSHMEEKAVKVLNKIPAFQEFMRKNSMIAGLFNIPDDYNSAGIAGLQTRDEVQKIIQQQMAMMGPGGAQAAQQNIFDAQSSLTNLRNKINQGSSELDMPEGKGNDQHTKSIFRRLEYGINIQNTRANNFYPVTTSFALTAGYKINNRSTAGIGVSYNMGWGENIEHIHISNQGIGLRSYLDIKIKGTFFATGGYEKNYNKVFTSLNQVVAGNLWQTSGLIGISKIISLTGKVVKKTKVQLLWNFLSYSQVPETQPIIFRFGYNF